MHYNGETGTKVESMMRPNPKIISPDATLAEAARQMAELDCGVLPVGSTEKPEGVITDRDIVLRAVAKDKDISVEKVRNFMTPLVYSCKTSETIEEAADKMREYQVGRLLVEEEDGKVCGILTFGSILRKNDSKQEIAEVVEHAVGNKAA